jgi:hypothetical protein
MVQFLKLSTYLVRSGMRVGNKPLMAQCFSRKKPWHNSCSTGSPDFLFFASLSTQES